MDNEALKDHYDRMYAGKEPKFDPAYDERKTIFNMMDSWERLRVLEIGCGEGDLAAMIAMFGGLVDGIDHSAQAINNAKAKHVNQGLYYQTKDFRDIGEEKYDVVVMQGVLEHLDKPWEELAWIVQYLLIDKGTIITSSPCFLNLRGHIWMTLALLFDVPMSLTDLHSLHPWEFIKFAQENDMEWRVKYSDLDWAHGKRLLKDFEKRLPAALSDGGWFDNGMPTENVERLLAWLEDYVKYVSPEGHLGANAIYKLTKKG